MTTIWLGVLVTSHGSGVRPSTTFESVAAAPDKDFVAAKVARAVESRRAAGADADGVLLQGETVPARTRPTGSTGVGPNLVGIDRRRGRASNRPPARKRRGKLRKGNLVAGRKAAAERIADIIEAHLEKFSEADHERLRRAASRFTTPGHAQSAMALASGQSS